MSIVQNKWHGLRAILSFDNSLQILLNRLLFRSDVMVYRYKGACILIDHSRGDAAGTRACIASRMYRQYLPGMQLDRSGIVVCDLGANGGGFPLMLKSEGYDIASLTAVEMHPATYARLQYNMYENFGSQARCLCQAVGGKDADVVLYLGRGSTADSLYDSEPAEGKIKHAVSMLTLQSLLRQYVPNDIDILKMDVEGAEYDVFLGGMPRDVLSRCRYLIIEIHERPHRHRTEVTHEIERCGFEELMRDTKLHPDIYCYRNYRLAGRKRHGVLPV